MNDPDRNRPQPQKTPPHSPFDRAAKIVLVLVAAGVLLTVLVFGSCLLMMR